MDDLERDTSDVSDPGASGGQVVALLYAIAILLVIAWLWAVVRAQQHSDTFGFSYDGEGGNTSVAERIDIAFQSIILLAYAAVVGGMAQIVTLLTRRSRS
jgi:hypothetical protein